jgi:hypothetical protein
VVKVEAPEEARVRVILPDGKKADVKTIWIEQGLGGKPGEVLLVLAKPRARRSSKQQDKGDNHAGIR